MSRAAVPDGAPVDGPLDRHLFGAGQPCFGCSPDHPHGFHLEFCRRGDVVTTEFTPRAEHQGPPGLMHGGLVMTLADELGAWTLIGLLGKFGFTAELRAKLQKPVRVGTRVHGSGRIAKAGSRVVKVVVSLEQAGELAVSADIDFVLVDASGAARLLGRPLPDAWKQFCR